MRVIITWNNRLDYGTETLLRERGGGERVVNNVREGVNYEAKYSKL